MIPDHYPNAAMADYADALVWFPGGRGARNMRKAAEVRGLTVYEGRPVTD